MGRRKCDSNPIAKLPPALTPEARENQLIALAQDRAEEQLRNGTASSQLIVHYLRLATQKEMLERKQLEAKNELLAAKTEALKAAERTEELYAEAIRAMRDYGGASASSDEPPDYDDY